MDGYGAKLGGKIVYSETFSCPHMRAVSRSWTVEHPVFIERSTAILSTISPPM
jgi:hypothetical protein